MENPSDRSESSNLPPPPSRPAADSIMNNGGSSASGGPFRIDDPGLNSVKKSMEAPSTTIEHFCRTMLSHRLAEHLCWELFSHGLATHRVPHLPNHLFELAPKPEPEPELDHLCRTMDGPGLAGLLESTVSDLPKIRGRIHSLADVAGLRAQLQAALKLAPKPADLIYQCSNHVKDGETYVLMMELFVQMMTDKEFEVEISASTKQKSQATARRWWNLYQASGGHGDDHRIQARAFLFFIVGFGISSVFSRDYIMNLIVLSYPCRISDTLRKAQVLVPMIPDMIKTMLQHKLYGEAIDVAFTFGIEDQFPYEPIMASLKGDYEQLKGDFEKTSRGLNEMAKAVMVLSKKYIALIEAMSDHHIRLDKPFHHFVLGIHTSILVADQKSRGNDGSVGEMEMEMEMAPPLARRLSKEKLRRKRSWREPVICNLI